MADRSIQWVEAMEPLEAGAANRSAFLDFDRVGVSGLLDQQVHFALVAVAIEIKGDYVGNLTALDFKTSIFK